MYKDIAIIVTIPNIAINILETPAKGSLLYGIFSVLLLVLVILLFSWFLSSCFFTCTMLNVFVAFPV